MKSRLLKILKPVATTLALGFTYVVIYKLTGFSLFCPIKKFTGLYCPGCGVSRMFLHLLRLDFAGAFSSNCVLFVMLPIFGAFGAVHAYRYVRYNEHGLKKWENTLCYVCIGILLVFGAARNLFPIDILVP